MEAQNEDQAKGQVKKPKKRTTKDGRDCAAAFVFEGRTYTDCTTTKSPDGKSTGEEWCYVDPNAGGSPNWGYCKPQLDYDKVREKSREMIEQMIVEVRKVTAMVQDQLGPVTKTMGMLENIRFKQSQVDKRVNALYQKIGALSANYELAVKIKDEWEKIEKDIKVLEKEVSKLKAAAEGGDKNPKDCEGLVGYEFEGAGDGIKASYFNNEDFLGTPVQQVDGNIEFDWDNEEPTKTINFENFSIKWSGFLRVPVSGEYTFVTESDDGNALLLNNQPIISHYFGVTESERAKAKSWLDFVKMNLKKNPHDSKIHRSLQTRAISHPINLEAGNKYKIDMLMFHSVHNKVKDDGRSFSRLLWSSSMISETPIKPEFFFTVNKVPPLKASGYNAALMELGIMKEFDNAFKDSALYKVADLPFQFNGYTCFKFNYEYNQPTLEFEVTAPSQVFIAVDIRHSNPLPSEFEDSLEVMSVLKVPKEAKPKKGKPIVASESKLYKIFKKKVPAGPLKVPLAFTESAPNAHMIAFYGLDPAASSPTSCGGNEVLVTLTTGDALEKCDQSSKLKGAGWSCKSAFANKMIDNQEAVWATDGQGVGSWITARFKKQFQLTKIQIMNRANPTERNKAIELSFGEGKQPQVFQLKNLDKVQDFKIDPAIIAKEVKISIKETFTSQNNGGAFNIFGIPCMDASDEEDPLKELGVQTNPNDVISVKCEDSIINKYNFEKMALKVGDSFTVNCEESCAMSPGQIYGDLIYSEDSPLCKSAFHSGALPPEGGEVKVKVVSGESYYKSINKNGVKSFSKKATALALTFEAKKKGGSSFNLYVGQMVDVFSKKTKQWEPGKIQSVDRVNAKGATIKVLKDGLTKEFTESFEWPDPEKVTYCSEKIPKRICPKKDLNPLTSLFQDLKIAFAPGPLEVEGYLLDNGAKFALHEQSKLTYGWSRDNTEMARTRHANDDKLLDSMILFTPDSKSKWCTDMKPFVSCEPIEWSILVPPGKYNVRVTVGDPKNEAQYNIQVNGKSLIARVLHKDQFFTPSEDIQVLDGKIVITSKCENECKFVWSRISAVQISKLPEGNDGQLNPDNVGETVKLGCGLAFKGGKCMLGDNNENCIYDTVQDPGVQGCSGSLMMVVINKGYMCKDQVGKFKCIKKEFANSEECESKCPAKCRGKVCLVKIEPLPK